METSLLKILEGCKNNRDFFEEQIMHDHDVADVFVATLRDYFLEEKGTLEENPEWFFWFTMLFWNSISSYKMEFVKEVLPVVLFVTFLMDYSVKKELKFFIISKSFGDEDYAENKNIVKEAIFSNQEFVSLDFSNPETVNHFISKITDFANKLSPDLIKNYLKEDFSDKDFAIIAQEIVDTLKYYQEIKDEDYIKEMKAFLFPYTFGEKALPKTNIKSETNLKTEEKKISPSYIDIKNKIIQFFPKNENGEIIDTEGVFEVLEKTADKYGDPKIKEIYYYNEATEKFEWSV